MRYRPWDLFAMLTTPAGRWQLRHGALYRLWPLLSRLALAYRRTVARRTRVVAVVGSFGKSTTRRAVAAAFGLPVDSDTMSNAWSAVALAVLRIGRRDRHAAIEIGIAAPGQMAGYARVVRPDVTVVTGIGGEHNRSLPTLEHTRQEKSWMVRALPTSGVAVLNGDDPNVLWMRRTTSARIVTFGFEANCDVRATDVHLEWPHGTRFRLHAFEQTRSVTIRLIGRHMIYPVLAAIAVCLVERHPLDEALRSLEQLPPTPGRLAPVSLANGVVLLADDYKSPAETIYSALDALAEVPARRRIVLLGDVTEPQGNVRLLYRQIGGRIAAIASQLVLCGHNVHSYAVGARRAGMPACAIHDGGRDVLSAAAALRTLLEPGDVVLVKGRGSQRFERIRLLLAGRRVGCDIPTCKVHVRPCSDCGMLERGWRGRKVVL